MSIQHKQIAIIGAGPGGLTLARLLQLKGADVKVYERDLNKDARVQGSPLDMHEESGWAALQRAELEDQFKNNVKIGADKKIITNERAEIIFSDYDTNAIGDNPARPEIDRGALRKIFLEALQPGTVVWDSHFVSMERQHSGWRINFKNGSSEYADLVIGADGANSKIRPYVTNIKAFYTGFTMVEVNIENAATASPDIYAMLNGGKVMAFGNGKCLLGGQKGNKGLGFYASFKPGENWSVKSGLNFNDKAQVLAWFKQEYQEWSSTWYEIFEHAVMPVIPRAIYCMPLDQCWDSLPNVTVIGDAAHVMPPFAGEGANTSMFDALELSDCLTSDKFDSLQEAVSCYEISMRKRASAAAGRSLENGDRMHSDGALQKMLKIFGVQ